MDTPMHERAIDWALAKGYSMSVRDFSEDEYDCQFTKDRGEIIDCIEGTELPNVEIYAPAPAGQGEEGAQVTRRSWQYVCQFSVIDEGIPAETINDYTISDKPLAKEFDQWFDRACDDYD